MSPSPIDNLPALGTHIFQSLPGTFKLYFPALTAAQASDNWIQSAGEIRYGPEERHVADVYRPTTDPLNDASSVSGPLRTLIWVHGGGLSQGDKSLPMCRAVYANVGHFFASKGYLVVRPVACLLLSPSEPDMALLPRDHRKTHSDRDELPPANRRYIRSSIWYSQQRPLSLRR